MEKLAMRINLTKNLGWIAAAGLLVVAGAVGFADQTQKVGVVDIAHVLEQSDLGKANLTKFNAMKSGREALLQYLDQNRVMTVDQANRLKELSLKDAPTKDEQTELDNLKTAIGASTKRWSDLNGKPTLTADERTSMEDFARRQQAMEQLGQGWNKDFNTELQTWADKTKADSVDKARAACQQVAKADGFTVVFESGAAPFGANDLTDETLKALNEKK